MNIDKLVFTGADDKTDYKDLVSRNSSNVEFGILFSLSKMGEQRYPTLQWILDLPSNLNLSGHLCGYYAKKAVDEGSIDLMSAILSKFKRFQINYNFQTLDDVEKIERLVNNYTDKFFILQFNKGNAAVIEKLSNKLFKNIHILYDSSGGRGTVIENIKPPFPNNYTGYSGGINTENFNSIFKKINDINVQDSVFIDMESGIRTNNEFDLSKVDSIIKNYIYAKNSNRL